MKRFKIKNKANGLQFQVEADALTMQPEYGKPAYTALDPVLDADGNPVLDAGGRPVMQERQVPAEFDIVEEDMTAELAANDARKAKRQAAIAQLAANIDWTQITTLAQMKAILKALVDKEFG